MDNSNASASLALGIDIGGSHISAGVVDLVHKNIVSGSVVRQPVNRHAAADEILGIWAGTINDRLQQYPSAAKAIGFAMPGPFDYTNGICLIKGFDKYEALYGMNIREALAARTGCAVDRFLFRNDADAFLDGEVQGGSAQGYSRVLALTLGTGLGSCVYLAGEITNAQLNVLPFKYGIAEEFLSTRWFVQSWQQRTGTAIDGVKELAEMYGRNETANRIFDEFATNLGEFLRYCVCTYDVEAILIGGNISNAYPLFIHQVQQQLPADRPLPVLKKAILGEQAAMIGAALHHQHNIVSTAY
ncbi:ROK family protein [Longitalea arenae]|uniref:ROK family protein n=1 Tax=Longitalea arenae TaxID=2812558 RepID=UPI0019684151|nr:ROK family protein [Longitalea arenae]